MAGLRQIVKVVAVAVGVWAAIGGGNWISANGPGMVGAQPSGDDAHPGDRVVLEWLDGREMRGRLMFLSPDAVGIAPESGGDGELVDVPVADLVGIRWIGSVLDTGANLYPMQTLHDGSQFRARVESIGDTDAELRTLWAEFGRSPVKIAVDQIRFATLAAPPIEPAISAERLAALVGETRPTSDVIVMRKDEAVATIEGVILAVNAHSVEFFWNDEERTLPRTKVYGVRFAELPIDRPIKAASGWLAVGAAGDERILAANLLRAPGADRGYVRLDRPDGKRFTFPLHMVSGVELLSPRVRSLAELAPRAVDSRSVLGRPLPMRVNATFRGTAMRLSGKIFSRGFGCHAPATITLDLDGDYERLITWVGVDDSAPAAGSVIFRVRDGDGHVLAESPLMRPEAEPARLVAEIPPGMKILVLDADAALGDGRLDVGDFADWAEPRLIRPRE